jgi:hypothetical protein
MTGRTSTCGSKKHPGTGPRPLLVLNALVLFAACGAVEGPLLTARRAGGAASSVKLMVHGSGNPQTVGDLNDIASRWAEGPSLDGFVVGPRLTSWTTTPLNLAPVRALAPRLREPPFDTLKANLLPVEFTLTTVRDENDAEFATVLENMAAAAQAARELGARGLFFDTQTYGTQVFSFPDAARGRQFEEAQASMEKRGKQVMNAMLSSFPELVVVLTIGYAEVWRSVCIDGNSLQTERYGLLPAFLDGMKSVLPAARQNQLVDGFLPSYSVRSGDAFTYLRSAIRFDEQALRAGNPATITTYRFPLDSAPDMLNTWSTPSPWRCDTAVRTQLERSLPVGFGLIVDLGTEPFDTVNFAKNFHSPETFSDVVQSALKAADDTVWIYSKAVDFWSRPGKTPLPPEYAAGLIRR